MNDPWHQETLDGLVAIIDAARQEGVATLAMVITSSERLGGEVEGELRGRVGGAETLRLCTYLDPRAVIRARLEQPRPHEFRTTIVQGLPAVLDSVQGEGLLGWLNFERESLMRPNEALVFVLSRETADQWATEAPDLDRYVARFEWVEWDDVVEEAERSVERLELEQGDDGPTKLQRAKERLAKAQKLGGELVVQTLVEVSELQRKAGLYADAERTLERAKSRVHGELRGDIVRAQVELLLDQGHPDEVLSILRSMDSPNAVLRTTPARNTWMHSYYDLGKLDEASTVFGGNSSRLAPIELLRGRIQSASSQRIYDTNTQARLLLVTGRLHTMLEGVMMARWLARFDGDSRATVESMMLVARAMLHVGRPRRSLELIEEAHTLPGRNSARIHDLAATRAEARWTLDGPSAVQAVAHDEEQRQQGWTAPFLVAELSHVRGLASTSDEDARRHLEDAAHRYRTMDDQYHLSEVDHRLAWLDRLQGNLDRASARIQQGLAWHVREAARPREARDRIELAMIALGRSKPKAARSEINQALDLILACGARIYEPAAFVALAAAERALGHDADARAHDERWRRLVRGIGAKGLEAALERDAAWAASVA